MVYATIVCVLGVKYPSYEAHNGRIFMNDIQDVGRILEDHHSVQWRECDGIELPCLMFSTLFLKFVNVFNNVKKSQML